MWILLSTNDNDDNDEIDSWQLTVDNWQLSVDSWQLTIDNDNDKTNISIINNK